MKKHLCILPLLSVFCIGITLISCSGKNEIDGKLVLAQGQLTTLEVPGEENTVIVRFNANKQWKSSNPENAEWILLDPESGDAGDITLTVSVSKNSGEPRSANFEVSCDNDKLIFSITQATAESAKAVSIPDDNFKAWLLEHYDIDKNNELSVEEAEKITSLDIPELDIVSLEGIKSMVNLISVNCRYNKIEGSLDFSGLEKLEEAICDHNYYSDLSFAGCKSLKRIVANDNIDWSQVAYPDYKLKTINLTGCQALEEIELTDNALTEINLSDCLNLKKLNVQYNQLNSIDISKCSKLKELSIRSNNFNNLDLDVTHCSDLEYLACYDAGIGSLNVKGCSKLVQLLAHGNKGIQSIDLGGCISLTELSLYNLSLSSIDLKDCTKLTSLDLSYNDNISRIDLTPCPLITKLSLNRNKIATLDISCCPLLETFNAEHNLLTGINLSGCSKMTSLVLGDNKLSQIDLSSNTSLISIDVKENQLASLDINNTKCVVLTCSNNPLTDLAIDKCKDLAELNAEHDKITAIDIEPNSSLVEVYLTGNGLSDIRLRNLKKLSTLYVDDNRLDKIDMTGCTALSNLSLMNNRIDYVSFYTVPALTGLDIRGNLVKSIDLSSNTSMSSLNAKDMPNLKSIFVHKNAAYSQLLYDDGVKVYTGDPGSFDNTDSRDWGDKDIDPWK